MRPHVTAIVAAIALSGCTTIPRVESAAPAVEPPLRVWIGFPIGSSNVHPIYVNREAHVAMFEIIPGRGATMVYPRFRAESFFSLAHWVDLDVQPGRAFYVNDPFSHAASQPRYYYAVASVAPLDLTRLHATLGSMRRVLGPMYSSYRPYEVIDRLTQLVVPRQADEDWATDLFIDWPTSRVPAPRAFAYRFVRCANGRMFPVPADYPYYGCPGDAQLAVVSDTVKPPIKELPVEPRRPRGDDRTGPIKYSDREGGDRRRAEAGAPPPRAGRGMTRSPTSEGIRYSGDRTGHAAVAEPARTPAPTRASAGGESAPVQRTDPPAEPASRGESSGKERKPDPR